MRKNKINKTVLFFLLSNLLTFSSYSLTLEELNELKNMNAISQEEYSILLKEIRQESLVDDNIYNLKMSGEIINKEFEILYENKKYYFPLFSFLKSISFKNYTIEKDRVFIYLGTELEEIILDLEKNKVFQLNKEISSTENFLKFILKNNEIYIESSIFEEIFLRYCDMNTQKLEVTMELGFTPPLSIDKLIEITKRNLERENQKKELVFNSKRDWFTLGYANIDTEYHFYKENNNSDYEKKLVGELGYQGGLLFGELSFDYDFEQEEIVDFKLKYDNIYREHNLEFSKDRLDSNGLWTMSFYKDEAYYREGGNIRIVEYVPLGTKAELLYMGVPIAVENEDDGKIEFDDKNIKENREYQIKLYYPNGKIILKNVVTTQDYNRQKLGEIEYNLKLSEVRRNQNKGYDSNFEIYYGLTNRTTLGVGLIRDMGIDNKGSKEYLSRLKGDLIFGDTFNGTSYVFNLKGEKSVSNFRDDDRNTSNKNLYGFLTEIRRNKWTTTFEEIHYGTYYDEKVQKNFNLSYDFIENLRFDYNYERVRKYNDLREEKSSLGVDFNHNIKNVLFNLSADFDLENSDKNEYGFDIYGNSSKNWTTRLENTWTNNGKDYEAVLEIYNNSFKGIIDFSAEVRYSNINKESFGITFSMIIEDWFTFDADLDKEGKRDFSIGVDKVIDLKNPTLNLASNDVSRGNIITFVDANNNNIYDEGEITVEDVQVEIGNKKVVTDKNGRATIYGISNGIEYEIKPKIRKPAYTLGESKIKVLSNFTSDIDIHIPIKPMMNLTGYINLDESLDLALENREEFYSNLIVQILDKKGEEVDLASTDNTGYFDISGLYPEDYIIKIYYVGKNYKISELNQELKLQYDENNFDVELLFNVTNEAIEIVGN